MNDIGVVDPNIDPRTNDAPVPFRVGNGIPAPAIDPEIGDIYVVWEDARFTSGAVNQVVISILSLIHI